MGLSKLDRHDKQIQESIRRKRKSSAVSSGPYVDGKEKMYTQGKGDRNRLMGNWHSNEVKQKLDKIFGKKKKSKTKSSN